MTMLMFRISFKFLVKLTFWLNCKVITDWKFYTVYDVEKLRGCVQAAEAFIVQLRQVKVEESP